MSEWRDLTSSLWLIVQLTGKWAPPTTLGPHYPADKPAQVFPLKTVGPLRWIKLVLWSQPHTAAIHFHKKKIKSGFVSQRVRPKSDVSIEDDWRLIWLSEVIHSSIAGVPGWRACRGGRLPSAQCSHAANQTLFFFLDKNQIRTLVSRRQTPSFPLHKMI